MKLIQLILAVALLIGLVGAVEVKWSQINLTESIPSGEGVIFSGTAPGTVTNTLYSDSGVLMWNGAAASDQSADYLVYKSGGNVIVKKAGVTVYTAATSTTNDLAALQYVAYDVPAAVNGVVVGNVVQLIGPFYISGELNINRSITMRGGQIYQNGSYTTLHVYKAPVSGSTRLMNVNFIDTYIQVNSTAGGTQYAVVCENTSWVDFSNVDIMSYVAGAGQLAVMLNATTEWTRFTDCHFRGSIYLSTSTDNWFKGCWINTYQSSSGTTVATSSMNNHFEGCHFISPTDGTTIYTPTLGLQSGSHQNNVIDCHFDGGGAATSGPAITIEQSYLNDITDSSFTYHHAQTIVINGTSSFLNTFGNLVFWNGNVADNSYNTVQLSGGTTSNTIAFCKWYIDESRSNKGYSLYEWNYLGQPNYNVVAYGAQATTYENAITVSGAQSKSVT
jgi:hypothetical protein